MVIGMNAALGNDNAGNAKDPVFDATTQDFEASVLKASMECPVLVDFWAPWCGPCRQLVPILEKAVRAQNGQVLLAKVNVDENPELAQAFRVQSVPMVVAMYQGQPVTAFAGVRPQAELEHLIAQLVQLHCQNMPDTLDIPAILAEAAKCAEQGDLGAAQEIYARILMEDETNIEAYTGMIRMMIAAGDLEQAEGLMGSAPEAIAKHAQFAAVKTALDLAKNAKDNGDLAELEARIVKNPDDWQAWFDLAEACLANGKKEQSVDSLMEIINHNKEWQDGKARQQLLKYFEAWGFTDPASIYGRRKLSSVLFS